MIPIRKKLVKQRGQFIITTSDFSMKKKSVTEDKKRKSENCERVMSLSKKNQLC
jgi:hypothetical protein